MEIYLFQLWNRVVEIVAVLPEVYEKPMFDAPAFYTGKKFFCRLREDGETLVLYNNNRDEWMERDAEVFFFTEHYKNYPLLLVDLKVVKTNDLKELLINSWKIRTSKMLLKNYRP